MSNNINKQAFIDAFHSQYVFDEWDYSNGMVAVHFAEDAIDAAQDQCAAQLGDDGRFGISHLFSSDVWILSCPLHIAADLLADEVLQVAAYEGCLTPYAAEIVMYRHKVQPFDATVDDRFLSDAAQRVVAELCEIGMDDVIWTNEACEGLARINWPSVTDPFDWQKRVLAYMVLRRDPLTSFAKRELCDEQITDLMRQARFAQYEPGCVSAAYDRLSALAESVDFAG